MRGRRNPEATMLAFVNLDERVPTDHPLRIIKQVADDVLDRMSDDFDRMYSKIGRSSVPPERPLKALLLISLYSIRSERDAALAMLMLIPGSRRLSVGADRGYDCRDFVAECRELNISPHVAQKERWSAIDGRTTRHEAYRSSQKVRKRVESIFGWMKTVGGFRRSRYVGLERTELCGELVATAYNLVRMSRLMGARKTEVPVFS